MTIKIGINGFGRIGRMVIRSLIENKKNDIKIQHINSRSNADIACSLLKNDSIHGRFNYKIKYDKKNLIINGKKFPFHNI